MQNLPKIYRQKPAKSNVSECSMEWGVTKFRDYILYKIFFTLMTFEVIVHGDINVIS